MKLNEVQREIAEYRIQRLFSLAKESTDSKSPMNGMGRRYIKIAEEISSHYRVRVPKRLKVQVCGSCHNLLVPGLNAKVRAVSGKGRKYMVYVCECGAERRILYS